MPKEATFSIRGLAELDIKQLTQQVEAAKKSFSKLAVPSSVESSFTSLFKKINDQIADFESKSTGTFSNMSDIKEAQKSYEKLQKYIRDYETAIQGIDLSKLSLKDKSVIQGFTQAVAAVKVFDAQVKDTSKEIGKLRSQFSAKMQAKINTDKLVEAAASGKALGSQLRSLQDQHKTNIAVNTSELDKANIRLQQIEQNIKTAQASVKTAKSNLAAAQGNLEDASTLDKRTKAYRVLKAAVEDATLAVAEQEKKLIEAQNERTQATRTISQLQKEQKALTVEAENIEKIKNVYNELRRSAGNIDLGAILGDDFKGQKGNLEQLKQILNNMSASELDQVNQIIEELSGSAAQAKTQTKAMGKALDEAANSGADIQRTANEVERLKEQVKDFFSIGNTIELFKRAVRSAYETVKELDATMTEAAVVTDFSVGDMWNQLPTYTKEASELGAKINDLYGATTLYYQQGLKTEAAMALGTETIKMARVGALEATDATELMTAALRGFNMELNETSGQRINDVYSELAAISAADTAQIGVAMSKTASIAANANMEFENTAALLTQIIETTQEAPETAGTALKTIIARFSEVKKLQSEGKTTGTDSEGEEIDINKIQGALRTVGISMDDFFNGTEGLDSILLRLASKWDTLDFQTQRYIATMAAGSRQQSRFLAMMSDYERTVELVNAANNSAGSSNEQFNKTLDSMEAKLNQLKDAWDQFTMGIANNEFIKIGIDLLTNLLETINKIIDGISGGNGLIKSAVSLGAVFGGLQLGKKVFSATGAGDKLGGIFRNKDTTTQSAGVGEEAASALGGKKAKAAATRSGQDIAANFVNSMQRATERLSSKKKFNINSFFNKAKPENLNKAFGLDELDFSNVTPKGMDKLKDNIMNQVMGMAIPENIKQNIGASLAFDDTINVDFINSQLEGTGQKIQILGKDAMSADSGLAKMSSSLNTVGQVAGIAGGAMLGLSAIMQAFGASDEAVQVVQGVGIALMALSAIAPVAGIAMQIAAYGGAAAFAQLAIAMWSALWPILLIAAGIAAIVAVIAILVSEAHKNSLAGQMEAAAEATERAADAAEKAKTAYDELLSDRSEYDEIQNNLAGLTRGTEEWKQALMETNQQVLELLNTYPQLAQYIGRGEDGQLTIDDEGWDKVIEDQQRAVNNANAALISSQMQETRLQQQQAERNIQKEYRATSGYTTTTYQGGYTVYDTQAGSGVEVNRGSGSDADIVFEGDVLDQMLEAYRENPDELVKTTVDAEGNTIYSDILEEIAAQSDQTAAELYETIDALAAYDAALTQNEATLQGQAESLLSTQASQETLDYEYGDDVISTFAKQMTTEDYAEREKELKDEVYKEDSSSESENNENFQNLANEYGVMNEMTGDDTHDMNVLYAAMAGLESVEDIPDGLKDNKHELAKEIGKMQAANEHQAGLEDFRTRMEGINNDTVERQIAGLMSGNADNFTLAEIGDLGNLSDYAGQLGYTNADEMAKALGYSTANLADLDKEDQQAYAETQVERTAEMDDEAYQQAIDEWIASNGSLEISAEVQMNLDSEQMKQQMQEAYNDAKAGLDTKGVDQSLYEDASIGVVENLSKQVSGMGEEDAQAYVQEWRNVIDSADLNEIDTRSMEEYLSTVDWSNMEEAVDAMEYLQNEGTDPTAMMEFWNAATDGANAFVSSVAEATALMDKIHEKEVNADALQERFINGEATSEDIAALEEAGVNLEGLLTRTADGWQMTEEAAMSATNVLRDNIIEQAQGSLDQQKQTIDEFNALVNANYGVGVNGMLTTRDEATGKLVAGDFASANDAVKTNVANQLGVNRDEYNSDAEYWAAAEAKYLEYINTVNNQGTILDIMQQEVDYQRATSMTAAQNEVSGGSEQSVIWSAQNEAQQNDIDPQEMIAYADAIQRANGELSKMTATQVALGNAKMNTGLGEIIDSYDEWTALIDETSGLIKTTGMEDAVTYDKLRKSVNKMLNTSEDLSEEFWNNAENLENIKKAAEGDVDALGELQKAATKDYLVNLALDPDNNFSEDAINAILTLADFIEGYELPKLNAGDILDDQEFIARCNELIAASGMTAEQVSSAFMSMGYDVEFDPNPQTVTEKQVVPVTTYSVSGSMTDGTLKMIPSVSMEEYEYESTVAAPTIKTLTSTGSMGGGVSTSNVNAGSGNKPSGGGGGGGGGGSDSEDPWEADYDWLYNLVNKTEEETRNLTKLQWEYDKALRASGTSARELLRNLEEQEESLKRQQQYYQQQQSGRYEELRRVQAEYSNVGQYAWYNESAGYVEIDWDAIDALSGTTGNNETGERIDEYISKLEEIQDQIDETEDALMDIEDQIAELDEQGWDEYVDLEQRIFDAIVQLRQDEIDKLTELNESINEANTKMLEKIQTGIDDYRNARQLEEDAENIQDMEGRLALMQSDTSGANALDILALQEELQDARQNYTDSLIDKSIEEMTRQNEQAYEQRQMQIDLMIAQLEWDQESGAIAQQTNELMTEYLKNGPTNMINLLKDTDLFKGMAAAEKEDWIETIEDAYAAGMASWVRNHYVKDTGKQITFTDSNGVKRTGTIVGEGQVKVGNTTYRGVYQTPDGGFTQELEGGSTPDTPVKPSTPPASTNTNNGATIPSKGWGVTVKKGAKFKDGQSFNESVRVSGFDPKHKGGFYIYQQSGNYYLLGNGGPSRAPNWTGWVHKQYLTPYATGGLADFTGPAWLDGSKAHPELVLNARDTENFIQLKNILADGLDGKGASGDNYYDVHIEVDQLSNDYDVEQMMDKMKRLIEEDAAYRNVNAVDLGRR